MIDKTKVCLHCGKEYQPTNGNQKYCPECGPVVYKTDIVKWKKENPEKRRASDAKRRKKNPAKRRASVAKWRIGNPEYNAEWRKANPEYHSKYRKANPEKIAVSVSKRRAAKYANTPISEMLTSTEWLAILAEAHGYCHYCGKEAKLTLDHVIPLSKGGKHSKDNVVPACFHCNSSKGNKTLEEWRRSDTFNSSSPPTQPRQSGL